MSLLLSEPAAVAAVMTGGVLAALLFRWAHLPLWPLTGGLAGSAAVNLGFELAVQMPQLLALAAQALVGAAIGSAITPQTFKEFRRFVAPGTFAIVCTLAAGLLFGWLFSALGLLPPAEAVLSLIPGGAGEMIAAAISLDLDSAVVLGAHVVRLLAVIWTLPLFIWVAEKLYGPEESSSD